jgi:hypothetical protein
MSNTYEDRYKSHEHEDLFIIYIPVFLSF